MNNDINLISGDSNVLSKEARRLKTFKLIGTSMVFGVGLLAILLFVLNRLFSPQSVMDQQNKVLGQISALQSKQAKFLILTQRVNDITNLIKKRTNYDIALSNILSQAPSDVVMTSLSINKKKISAIITSSSLVSLSSLIDTLKGMVDKKEFIKNVTISSLSLEGKSGSYVLTLNMEIL